MLNKRTLTTLFCCFSAVLISLLSIPNLYAQDSEAKDAFCKAKLLGTSSIESCLIACPGGALDCVRVQTHRAQFNPKLNQDLECYGCASRQSCYDLGLIYGFPDCAICEANPFKKCVNATPIPVVGGSISLPKDSDGFQCWDCIDDPDTCWKHWLGSTEKTACEAICKKPNHKCVKVGINPDNGYNCYRCVDMTPPKTCKDYGYIYQAQCTTCPPNKPKCVPASSIWFGGAVTDASGARCYECVKGPKTCKEQGLQEKCAPNETCEKITAPNGAKCCNCKKKPKTCKDYKMQKPPCKCKEGYNKVERLVNSTQRKKIRCCKCEKDPCHPDLKESDCKKCEAKGGRCEPITKVRGAPQCYRCVMPKKKPKNCQELRMHDSCSPNPCPEGYNCEMVDTGHGFKCADCVPDDSIQPPNNCESHPTHKQPNCAICYNAQMACETVRLSDNPLQYCAKCLPPLYQRCPRGTIEGYCSNPWCVEGLKCVNATVPGKQCHYCVPPEQCAPGRYRTANCDNKCVQGKEECRRIEGCEFSFGEDPRDVAVIESMDPNDKYCGPDITEMLKNSLNLVRSRTRQLSNNEKGAIDGTMFLDKNGMSIDLRASPISKQDGSPVCPSKPCKAGSMKSVILCGHCVMEHIGNDILFGYVANQLDVPWHIQLLGAHYAEVTSYGGLDPLASQAAYMFGNDASTSVNKKGVLSVEDICKIFENSTIKTGAFTATPGFKIMREEQSFLKDCKPCKFAKTKVLKDFAEGKWRLEDGYAEYTPVRGKPDYCCYACFPIPPGTETALVVPQPDTVVSVDQGQTDLASIDTFTPIEPIETPIKSYFDIEYAIPGTACMKDSECDDGTFCNGGEICQENRCFHLGNPCAQSTCNEGAQTCSGPAPQDCQTGVNDKGICIDYIDVEEVRVNPDFDFFVTPQFTFEVQPVEDHQAEPEIDEEEASLIELLEEIVLEPEESSLFDFDGSDLYPQYERTPCIPRDPCPCCQDIINTLPELLEQFNATRSDPFEAMLRMTYEGWHIERLNRDKERAFNRMHDTSKSDYVRNNSRHQYNRLVGVIYSQQSRFRERIAIINEAIDQSNQILEAILAALDNFLNNCECLAGVDQCCRDNIYSGSCRSGLEYFREKVNEKKRELDEAKSDLADFTAQAESTWNSTSGAPSGHQKEDIKQKLLHFSFGGLYFNFSSTFLRCCEGQKCPTDSGTILPEGETPIFTDGFESGNISPWSTEDVPAQREPKTQTSDSIELDRTVYPVPMGDTGPDTIDPSDISSTTGRSIFPIHAIGDDFGIDDANFDEILGAGDNIPHVRIADPDFDVAKTTDTDLLIGGGGFIPSFQGYDLATGNFGDITFTNFYDSPVNFTIPVGSYFNPFTFDVQRMTTSNNVNGTVQSGQSATFLLNGVCLDAWLYPPPSGKATRDFLFSTPLNNHFNMFGDVFQDANGYNFFDAKSCQNTHGPVYSLDSSTLTSDMLRGLKISPKVFEEQFLIPQLAGMIDAMYAAGEIPPTGLPKQMERDTLLQWIVWEITDDFDKDDGLKKITEQVQSAGGTQTPEQIKALNESVWKNIEAIKAKVKSFKVGTTLKRHNREKSQETVLSQLMSMMSFERPAYAQDAQPNELKVETNNVMHRLRTVLFLAQNVTFEIEKLVETSHAKKISKAKSGLAKPIRNKLTNIQKKAQESRPVFTEVRALNDDDFKFMIKKKNAIVKKGGDVHKLWKEVKKRLKPVYPVWDNEYMKLLERSQRALQQGKDYTDGFTKGERQFFKIFSRLKLYYLTLEKIYE